MDKKNNVAVAFFVLFFSLSAMAGGVSSGGGNAVQVPNQTAATLLDFYIYGYENKGPPSSCQIATTPTLMIQYLGYDYFDDLLEKSSCSEVSNAIENAKVRLKQSSPLGYQIVTLALERMQFRYIREEYNFSDGYTIPQNISIPEEQVKVVAWYHRDIGPIFSAKGWNRLDTLSQAGLWVHEALRHFQLRYMNDFIDDTALQALTAKIFNILVDENSVDQMIKSLNPTGFIDLRKHPFDIVSQKAKTFDHNLVLYFQGNYRAKSPLEEVYFREKSEVILKMWSDFRTRKYIRE